MIEIENKIIKLLNSDSTSELAGDVKLRTFDIVLCFLMFKESKLLEEYGGEGFFTHAQIQSLLSPYAKQKEDISINTVNGILNRLLLSGHIFITRVDKKDCYVLTPGGKDLVRAYLLNLDDINETITQCYRNICNYIKDKLKLYSLGNIEVNDEYYARINEDIINYLHIGHICIAVLRKESEELNQSINTIFKQSKDKKDVLDFLEEQTKKIIDTIEQILQVVSNIEIENLIDILIDTIPKNVKFSNKLGIVLNGISRQKETSNDLIQQWCITSSKINEKIRSITLVPDWDEQYKRKILSLFKYHIDEKIEVYLPGSLYSGVLLERKETLRELLLHKTKAPKSYKPDFGMTTEEVKEHKISEKIELFLQRLDNELSVDKTFLSILFETIEDEKEYTEAYICGLEYASKNKLIKSKLNEDWFVLNKYFKFKPLHARKVQ